MLYVGVQIARAEDLLPAPATPLLSLAIRCTNTDLKAGDEIPIEFTITNKGTNDYKYADRTYDRSGRMGEYKLVAHNASGKEIPDPRAVSKGFWNAGGLFQYKILKPGESFTRIIPLNRWALVKEGGRYVVVGTYFAERYSTNSTAVSSDPVSIDVLPRSLQEMDDYINNLSNQITALPSIQNLQGQGRPDSTLQLDDFIKKLMFTCSPTIVPTLLPSMYEPRQGFWESEALLFYVPRSDETKQLIITTAAKRGLAGGMQNVLSEYGCRGGEFRPLIERSLAPENPQSWMAGALAAQQYANDIFTPRLIALATEPQNPARVQAIYALAANRTDESVKTLKVLLNDPDPKIRQDVEQAVRTSYNYRGIWQGRLLKPDDFDAKFQEPK